MKIIKATKNWGVVYHYFGDNYKFALYTYNDDPYVTYLSNVWVNDESRGQGIGDKLLNVAEEMAIQHNAKVICLKVLVDTWVHDWYQRQGFIDYIDDEDSNYVWMKKVLKDK